jgi:hypothetical protein
MKKSKEFIVDPVLKSLNSAITRFGNQVREANSIISKYETTRMLAQQKLDYYKKQREVFAKQIS